MGLVNDDGTERMSFSEGEVVLGQTGQSGYAARLFREVKALRLILANYHANRTLEIGCGYGRLSPWIADEITEEYYGTDGEEALIELARTYYPGLDFRHALAQRLPFPNDEFDLCISWTVLQHVPDSAIPDAVSEIKRVLQPGGILIIAEEVKDEEGRENPFEFPRSLSHYIELFRPLRLFNCIPRPSTGKILRFEGGGI